MIRFLLLTGIDWTDANQNMLLVVGAFVLLPFIWGAMALLRWLA